MAKQPTIKTISSGYASNTQLNFNFEALRDAFSNTLSRDGSTPNTMSADLDMNSNDVLNIGTFQASTIRLGDQNLSLADISTLIEEADRHIGSSATDPSTREDGTALQAGDMYFNTVDEVIYVYTGSTWISSLGTAATISVGTVTTGAEGSSATVANSGTTTAAVFDFSIPVGATGATGSQGDAATISVGTVATGAEGSSATVTNSGTSSAAVFDFSIPVGATGATGPTGATGATGPAGNDGLGFTGGSYNASTGIITFTSDDGLGFSTGDLRGAGDLLSTNNLSDLANVATARTNLDVDQAGTAVALAIALG